MVYKLPDRRVLTVFFMCLVVSLSALPVLAQGTGMLQQPNCEITRIEIARWEDGSGNGDLFISTKNFPVDVTYSPSVLSDNMDISVMVGNKVFSKNREYQVIKNDVRGALRTGLYVDLGVTSKPYNFADLSNSDLNEIQTHLNDLKAVIVRGNGNAYCTTTPNTVYSPKNYCMFKDTRSPDGQDSIAGANQMTEEQCKSYCLDVRSRNTWGPQYGQCRMYGTSIFSDEFNVLPITQSITCKFANVETYQWAICAANAPEGGKCEARQPSGGNAQCTFSTIADYQGQRYVYDARLHEGSQWWHCQVLSDPAVTLDNSPTLKEIEFDCSKHPDLVIESIGYVHSVEKVAVRICNLGKGAAHDISYGFAVKKGVEPVTSIMREGPNQRMASLASNECISSHFTPAELNMEPGQTYSIHAKVDVTQEIPEEDEAAGGTLSLESYNNVKDFTVAIPLAPIATSATPPASNIYIFEKTAAHILKMIVNLTPIDYAYDINNDGNITMLDSQAYLQATSIPEKLVNGDKQYLVGRMLVNLTPLDYSYDINKDNKIDVADMTAYAFAITCKFNNLGDDQWAICAANAAEGGQCEARNPSGGSAQCQFSKMSAYGTQKYVYDARLHYTGASEWWSCQVITDPRNDPDKYDPHIASGTVEFDCSPLDLSPLESFSVGETTLQEDYYTWPQGRHNRYSATYYKEGSQNEHITIEVRVFPPEDEGNSDAYLRNTLVPSYPVMSLSSVLGSAVYFYTSDTDSRVVWSSDNHKSIVEIKFVGSIPESTRNVILQRYLDKFPSRLTMPLVLPSKTGWSWTDIPFVGPILEFFGVGDDKPAVVESAPRPMTCTDSDNGKNIETKGRTIGIESRSDGTLVKKTDGSYDTMEESDYCQDNYIVEWYCKSNGAIAAEEKACQNGCSDGKCIPPKPTLEQQQYLPSIPGYTLSYVTYKYQIDVNGKKADLFDVRYTSISDTTVWVSVYVWKFDKETDAASLLSESVQTQEGIEEVGIPTTLKGNKVLVQSQAAKWPHNNLVYTFNLVKSDKNPVLDAYLNQFPSRLQVQTVHIPLFITAQTFPHQKTIEELDTACNSDSNRPDTTLQYRFVGLSGVPFDLSNFWPVYSSDTVYLKSQSGDVMTLYRDDSSQMDPQLQQLGIKVRKWFYGPGSKDDDWSVTSRITFDKTGKILMSKYDPHTTTNPYPILCAIKESNPYGCQDTDSNTADQYAIKGSVKELGFQNAITWEGSDYCDMDNRVVEASCTDGYGKNTPHECTNGCSDGACLPYCIDSDGGIDLFEYGQTEGTNPSNKEHDSGSDICGTGNPYAVGTLIEHYCDGAYHTNISIVCLYGCNADTRTCNRPETAVTPPTHCQEKQLSFSFESNQGYGLETYTCTGPMPKTAIRSKGVWGSDADPTSSKTGPNCKWGNKEGAHRSVLTSNSAGTCNNYCSLIADCNENGEWVNIRYTW